MTATKQIINSLYCHYSGFSALLMEKTIADTDYEEWERCEKRWTVSKLIKGIASYDLISKALKEIKSIGQGTYPIIINKEIELNRIISGVRFKGSTSTDMTSNVDINANIFNLVARVNDEQIVFKKEASSLIESVKFFNPANHDNDLNALILAVNAIPYSSFNYLLIS